MKKIILNVLLVMMLVCFSNLESLEVQAANTTNKAWSVEYFKGWWYYDGTLRFVPSYVVPKNPGYSLKEGKQVKRGYINYTRKKNGKDVSVIGGRAYTQEATSKKSKSVYQVTATAKDSLNIFTNQTRFWYGWKYF